MSKKRMEKALKGVRVKDNLTKSQTVLFRCSVTDKESIAATASKLKMSMSEYLMNAHYLIVSRLK